MGFVEAIKSGFANYVDFSGRAIRSEYWFWILFQAIGQLVTDLFDLTTGFPLTRVIFLLATIVPSIAVAVRRLHDLDKSGWWFLLTFIPIIGWIILIIWYCTMGTAGPNRFGPDRFAAIRSGAQPQAA